MRRLSVKGAKVPSKLKTDIRRVRAHKCCQNPKPTYLPQSDLSPTIPCAAGIPEDVGTSESTSTKIQLGFKPCMIGIKYRVSLALLLRAVLL